MIVNANSVVHVFQIKKENNETCQCKCKNYSMGKRDDSWNPSTSIHGNGK